MSKISTKPKMVSAVDMYYKYIQEKFLSQNTPELKIYKTKTYRHYISSGVVVEAATSKVVFDYGVFKDILSAFNKAAQDKLIAGQALKLGYGLGDIFMARIERPPQSTRLNQLESRKLYLQRKQDGTLTNENWKVFYTDDDYVATIWHKGNGRLRNVHLYKFKTATGKNKSSPDGFSARISKAHKANQHLKVRYPYLPCKELEPIE